MMTFSQIDDSLYDKVATEITYYKLFPLMMEDFLTRVDSNEMMAATNLIVQTDAGQNVATTGSPAAQTGFTTSPGQGRVTPPYTGSYKKAATITLAERKKALKEAGGTATEGIVDTAIG